MGPPGRGKSARGELMECGPIREGCEVYITACETVSGKCMGLLFILKAMGIHFILHRGV